MDEYQQLELFFLELKQTYTSFQHVHLIEQVRSFPDQLKPLEFIRSSYAPVFSLKHLIIQVP